MENRIIIDVSEFIDCAARSGIPRVERKLITYWPQHVSAIFARYDPATNVLIEIPDRALEVALRTRPYDDLDDSTVQEAISYILRQSASKPLRLSSKQKILIPEVFYQKERVEFYRQREIETPNRNYFIVYDFIPWLKPDTIELSRYAATYTMYYLELIRLVGARCFISQAVHDEFATRIMRTGPQCFGIVNELGADGIDGESKLVSSERRHFCCIGAFDGKKGQDIVFEAFCRLNMNASHHHLYFVGRVPQRPADRFRRLLSCERPDVHVIKDANDQQILDIMQGCRATVFVSQNEGFGLPVVESLHLGIPVIASSNAPCLSTLPPGGQIRLDRVDVDTVENAMRKLQDDAFAERLSHEARCLRLQTWKEYVNSVADWVSSPSPDKAHTT